MVILAALVVGILEVLVQFVIEVAGYLIWGILEAMMTKAGGLLGGAFLGGAISIVIFCCHSSIWLATCWSCGVMVSAIGLGLLIEAAGGMK